MNEHWVEIHTFTARNGPELNETSSEDIPNGRYVPASVLKAAMDTLKLIAVAHATSGEHAVDVALARNTLEALGVSPELWRRR